MTAEAQEIGFIEQFSLAEDRTVPLSHLIPGTWEYYYFHCLHYQNTQQYEQAEKILAAWQQQHSDTRHFRQMRYRQALLTYNRNPQQSLAFLSRELGLTFSHQRDRLGNAPDVPSAFDEALLDRERLTEIALKQPNVNGFEDTAFRWLIAQDLDPEIRRALLQRLPGPDYEDLPRIIAEDLQYKNSGGFGSLPVHSMLLKDQLDELLKRQPRLRSNTQFVHTYLARLAPDDDVDLQQETDAHKAWLDRLHNFVRRLDPAHNSLKAHVLHHLLLFEQQTGQLSRDHFLEYIQLPRHAAYVNQEWLTSGNVSNHLCDLNKDFGALTSLRPAGDDSDLVRDYLLHFFVKDTEYSDFEPFLNDVYLSHLFAEAKIVNGLGDAEQWYALLPPEDYRLLKDRVDIDFAPTSRRYFAADDPVALDVSIKNVSELIVKVFEINTLNFHRDNLRDVNTDINLDGLVANHEHTYHYSEPPLRRVARRFEFPDLARPGTYVIDFIGNGRSSRALIRKGQLRFLEQPTNAGHAFTVLDENDTVVKDARLYLGGQQYDAAADGRILVPFSTAPRRRKVVVADSAGFSAVGEFDHAAEAWQLTAQMHVDRESLLRQREAMLLVRPLLKINGQPTSLTQLSDVTLTIVSVDHDGTRSLQEVPDFPLFEDRESIHEFAVPPRLASLTFNLKATVRHRTTQKDVSLESSHTVSVNRIETTEQVSDLFLLRSGDAFLLELRGRTGELRAGRPVQVRLKHREFRQPIRQTLATDEQGQISLGSLHGIDSIKVSGEGIAERRWQLHVEQDQHDYYAVTHASAGEPIQIPWMASGPLTRDQLSLFALRGGQLSADRFSHVKAKDGFLVITGLSPGDYQLNLHPVRKRLLLRVTRGRSEGHFLLGRNRQLELRGQQPLQIASVSSDDSTITIKLANASEFARVHLFATRYVPEFNAFADLLVQDAQPRAVTHSRWPLSSYVEGRNIGDEYRYILERRNSPRFPGNMNERPGVLLNPFVLQSTDTGEQRPEAGGEFHASDEAPAAAVMESERAGETSAETGGFACLDFLPSASLVAVNLVPDDDGTITFSIDKLGPHQHLRVVAVDTLHTASRSHTLKAASPTRIDLRLARSLDPTKHFIQSQSFRIVSEGEQLTTDQSSSVRMQVIDSLPRVFQLYNTLHADTALGEFDFVLRWPALELSERQTLYSQFACHELNFFLARKDPEFFEDIVRPYLQNKMHKTFMDHYLLENDLSGYLRPWAHARLNVAEQILLAERIDGEFERTGQLIADRSDLIPRDMLSDTLLFETALSSLALSREQLGEELAAATLQDGASPGEIDINRFGIRPLWMRGGAVDARGRVNELSRMRATETAAEEKLKEVESMARQSLGRNLWEDRRAAGQSDFGDDSGGRAMFFTMPTRDPDLLYQQLDPTQEWVENNYYRLPVEGQLASLITVNAFWRDYATRDRSQPFLSRNVLEPTGSFAEMMLALAVIDLPFESPEHATELKEGVATFTAAGPVIAAIDEIKPAEVNDDASPVLVSQNFYQHNDRYRHEGAQKLDKFLTEEFVINTVYGCQVAVTNPTSAPRELTLVLQVPTGALPVLNTHYTRRVPVRLEPFTTRTHDYYFYFPSAGTFEHFPVQVADGEQVVAHAPPMVFPVVAKPTSVDTESWDYVSQFASAAQVLEYLRTQNLQRVQLDRIAWRMQDVDFFTEATRILHARHSFDKTLWSYAIHHNVPERIREFLASSPGVTGNVGPQIDSPLLTVNPVERHTFQLRDYSPLVNARAHKLGAARTILNDRFRLQYMALMDMLAYQQTFDDDQKLSLTSALLLQDRTAEALETFASVNPDKVAARIQYDYCAAYLDFFNDAPDRARALCRQYADYPVERWRRLFAAMRAQLDELDGEPPTTIDPEKKEQRHDLLASSDCSFDLRVASSEVAIDFQNLETVTVNYYLMDVELLFSRNPFVQQYGERFSSIRPNLTATLELPADQSSVTFPLPGDLRNSNVLVEVVGRGKKKSAAYYANSLTLQVIDNYGQVKVTDSESARGLPRVYVKAYARMKNGEVKFYKDGYTDLRGRFDYASISTGGLDDVDRFSLLVLSETHGATVEEAAPPQR